MKPGGDASKPVGDLVGSDHVQAATDARLDAPGYAMNENPSATGLVTMDADGKGVACEFTMNAPFGSARIAPGTGIILAPAPNDRGAGFSALGPIMLASNSSGRLYFLAAGSGEIACGKVKKLAGSYFCFTNSSELNASPQYCQR